MPFPVVRGRVWKFGDNISTDLLMPGIVLANPDMSDKDAAQYVMYSNRPGWAELVKPGDIIVGGKNFGCGSSRPAPKLLRTLRIDCVIAESIARIFFRNSISLGLPVLTAPGIQAFCSEGDLLEVNFESGVIRNISQRKTMNGQPLPKDSPPLQILKAGGLKYVFEKEL